jgi:hypothetical protein
MKATVWIILAASARLAAPLSAQRTADRGAFLLLTGKDTIVVDRFIRTADTLEGSVQVTGQARIDYRAVLGPNDRVQVLLLGVFAPGAAANAAPTQRIRLAVRADTVVVENAAGTQRIATKPEAIPMFNNALALTELFTRRARAAGGNAEVPYFAINGGTTLPAVMHPVGADSLTLTIAQQVERLRVDSVGRILGGVIAGTPIEIVRLGAGAAEGLTVALQDAAVAPKTDYSAPAGAPYTAEEVRLKGPAGTLGGTLTKPANGGGRFPAVVTITGSGQQDRDEYIPFAGGIRLFRQVADTVSRRGIAVLRLDDRGLGASEGAAATSTSADFADDIRAGIAFLRARPDIDPDRIALVGHSEGGAIAPMIAATDPRLKAIVIMAGPAEPGIELSLAQNKFLLDRDTTLTPRQRDSLLRSARASLDVAAKQSPWLRYFLTYDPGPTARQVKAATLILQGATDRQVPASQAEKLAGLIRSGGNRDVTVRVFPATNHLFVDDPSGDFIDYPKLKSNLVSQPVLGALADWLATKLAAGASRK